MHVRQLLCGAGHHRQHLRPRCGVRAPRDCPPPMEALAPTADAASVAPGSAWALIQASVIPHLLVWYVANCTPNERRGRVSWGNDGAGGARVGQQAWRQAAAPCATGPDVVAALHAPHQAASTRSVALKLAAERMRSSPRGALLAAAAGLTADAVDAHGPRHALCHALIANRLLGGVEADCERASGWRGGQQHAHGARAAVSRRARWGR